MGLLLRCLFEGLDARLKFVDVFEEFRFVLIGHCRGELRTTKKACCGEAEKEIGDAATWERLNARACFYRRWDSAQSLALNGAVR